MMAMVVWVNPFVVTHPWHADGMRLAAAAAAGAVVAVAVTPAAAAAVRGKKSGVISKQ